MKLLLDANISWRLVRLLQDTYSDVIHINDTSLPKSAKDYEIWLFAKEQNRLIISNDEDFYKLSLLKGFPPKVVILRSGNQSTQKIAQILVNHKKDIQALMEAPETGILELI